MSSLSAFFGFGSGSNDEELPSIYPLTVKEEEFVKIDVLNIFTKILTDVVERTQGIKEEDEALLWDNCLASESSDGLITMLARAMVDRSELFLVRDKSTEVLRRASAAETTVIKADYLKMASSKVGTYISFKNYARTDMVKLYSAIEYSTVSGLYKSMKISTAIQMKISDLRASVSLADAASAKSQAGKIARSLKNGCDVYMDAKDTVETAKPDLTPIQASILMLNQKKSYYLGLPASYITGELPGGLGDSGLGDAKAVERGLKNYFFAIIRPVLKSIFDQVVTFKSEDFEQLTSALEAMKTFELTSGEYMSTENKRVIINKLFGLPEDEEGDAPEKEVGPSNLLPATAPPKKVVG